MFHAVFLITLGFLLLSNNFGLLPWSIWNNLIPYWPVLFIFAGIDTIFGKSVAGRLLASAVNSIIFLAIVARVSGFDIDILRIIPLPKRDVPKQELFFTDENVIHYGFNNRNGRKNFF